MAKLGDVLGYLTKNGTAFEVIEHVPAYSAHEVAVASRTAENKLAKTLIVRADDRFVMAVIPGDHRLDEHELRALLGAKHLHLAHEEDLKPIFPDCELGAMPPFGNLYALPVYLDASLAKDDEIIFNACSHTKSIRMKTAEYVRLVHPSIAPFSHSRFEVAGG